MDPLVGYPRTPIWEMINQRLKGQPQTEWQLYGAIAAALRYIFPPTLGFLIRCQPRFVQLAHHFAGDEKKRRDSHGYMVSFPSSEGNMVADFEVVCLSPDSQVIMTVLVCEVKLDDDEEAAGMSQLLDYMDRLSAGDQHLDPDGTFRRVYQGYRTTLPAIRGLLLIRDEARLMSKDAWLSEISADLLSNDQGAVYKELWGIRTAWANGNINRAMGNNRIPQWLEVIMMKMDADGESPEASFYGPEYEILCTQFPLDDDYFVKPQAAILEKAANNTPLSHRRITSLGYEAKTGGKPIYIVDFLVVKFESIDANNVAKDKVIFAFEAKKYEDEMDRTARSDEKLQEQISGVLTALYQFIGHPYNGLISIGWDAWLVTWVNDNGTPRIQLPEVNDKNKITKPGEKLHNENASFWPVLRLAQPLPGR